MAVGGRMVMSDLRAAAERAPTIGTGDLVFHRPSRETWLVAYVRGRHLCACGWPESLADLSDCLLVEKASADERMELLQSMASGSGSDSRNRYARAALAAEQPQPKPVAWRCQFSDGRWHYIHGDRDPSEALSPGMAATLQRLYTDPPPPAAPEPSEAEVEAAMAAWNSEVDVYDGEHPMGGSWTECRIRAVRAALRAAAAARTKC